MYLSLSRKLAFPNTHNVRNRKRTERAGEMILFRNCRASAVVVFLSFLFGTTTRSHTHANMLQYWQKVFIVVHVYIYIFFFKGGGSVWSIWQISFKSYTVNLGFFFLSMLMLRGLFATVSINKTRSLCSRHTHTYTHKTHSGERMGKEDAHNRMEIRGG